MSNFDETLSDLFAKFKEGAATELVANEQEASDQRDFLKEFADIREDVILPRLRKVEQQPVAVSAEYLSVQVSDADRGCPELRFNGGAWRLEFRANPKTRRVEVGRRFLSGSRDTTNGLRLEQVTKETVEKEVTAFVEEALAAIQANLRRRSQ